MTSLRTLKLLLIGACLLACNKTPATSETTTAAAAAVHEATSTPTPPPPAEAPAPPAAKPAEVATPPASPAKALELTTSLGKITLELDAAKAPQTVANVVTYADAKFYDGTIFHRVIDRFMIQGGGFDRTFSEKQTRAPVVNEADNGLKNVRGSVAMARTPDPNSATAQFFINLKDNDFLNFRDKTMQGWGYAVFGRVTAGMDVVERIAKVKTGPRGPHQDVPIEDVVITSVRVIR